MSDHEHCYLLAIYPNDHQMLYRDFRDYLIFLSLIRELSQTTETKLYGFSWLPQQCLHLGQFTQPCFIDHWLALMKRYCYWLQIVARPERHFTIRLIQLSSRETLLEALKYLHLRVCHYNKISDPLAYHWHSLPIYHDYWEMPWLDKQYVLSSYSTNDIMARDQFRQHMITPQSTNFDSELVEQDIALKYLSDRHHPLLPQPIGIKEHTSEYHKNFLQQCALEVFTKGDELNFCVRQQNGGGMN